MSWAGWRKVEPGYWWCPDFGTAVQKPDGWWASRSGYPRTILIEPIVGPFATVKLAIAAYEEAMRRRADRTTENQTTENQTTENKRR